MTDLDIMRLALEALEVATTPFARDRQEVLRAQAALREALAEQPAQQEPVAVVSGYYGGQCVILPIDPARIFNSNTAFYTAPPQRKPPQFPTMLRKMWSGAEVQKWINENWEQS
ncbi:hypothetical protein UFOVP652_39 [uncultured Caudovirales phage]|uniref:Uncharacterized protein n=2 Tax=uncultured Caudovirales phage TaxID=2100421 RepID=A0A6J5NCX1_9CAUD|nr:hypothetical protein UFOVP652_39 [uncultured Caudovirales phage]